MSGLHVRVHASREGTQDRANFDVAAELHAERCDDLAPIATAREKGCREIRVGARRCAPIELLFDGFEHIVHDCFVRESTRELGAERRQPMIWTVC